MSNPGPSSSSTTNTNALYTSVPQTPASSYATYSTDASGNVTGLVSPIGSAPILLNKSRSNILTRSVTGQCQLAAAFSGYTHHIQTQLAAKPIAIRIGFPTVDSAASGATAIKCCFGFDSAMGAVGSNQSKGGSVTTWTNLTFASSTTGTFAANGAAATPAWLWSDWVQSPGSVNPTDGTIYPILHLRILETNANTNQTWVNAPYAASTTTEAASLGGSGTVNRTWRGYRSNTATDYVSSNQSLFPANSGVAVGGYRNCVIQYVCLETGVTLFSCGDSIYADMAATGVLTAAAWGHTNRLAELLHSSSVPVEVCNLGWSGQNSTTYLARFQAVAAQIGKSILLYAAFSPNDANPPTLASTYSVRANYGMAMQLANQYGMTIVHQSGIPANAPLASGGSGGASAVTWGASDSYRTVYNSLLLNTQNYTFDISSVLSASNPISSGTATGQIEYNQTYTTDGLHPNEAGQIAWANALATYLKGAI